MKPLLSACSTIYLKKYLGWLGCGVTLAIGMDAALAADKPGLTKIKTNR